MFFDVLKDNKLIKRGYRAIRVHLVLQKLDINTILSNIATPLKPKNRINIHQFELLLYIIDCNSYFSKVILWWINKVCSHNILSEDLQGHE